MNHLTDLMTQRIQDESEQLRSQFQREHAVKVARHFALDNLLPDDIAHSIYASFPKAHEMRSLSSGGECKLKYGKMASVSDTIKAINAAIQDPRMVSLIENITGIAKQVPDESQHAGGVSMLMKGHYINPHIDNSHDPDKKRYRTVNVLYYISPDWRVENGGNYELWDASVTKSVLVPSLFNRLVVMETNRNSWHSVSRVVCEKPRCCVFNYYFSDESPEQEPYYNATVFSARPEQTIRRGIAAMKKAVFHGRKP